MCDAIPRRTRSSPSVIIIKSSVIIIKSSVIIIKSSVIIIKISTYLQLALGPHVYVEREQRQVLRGVHLWKKWPPSSVKFAEIRSQLGISLHRHDLRHRAALRAAVPRDLPY